MSAHPEEEARREEETRRIVPVLLLVGLLILIGLLFGRTSSLHGAHSGPTNTAPTAVDDDARVGDKARVDDDTREEGPWT